MYTFFGLVLLSALAAVGAERTKFNDALDGIIKYINDQQRQNGASSAVMPDIQLDSNVKFSNAVFLGVDSLKRTADAWKEVKGNDVTFDISYGFGLLTIVLPQLEISGTNMSAYADIRDNSVHLSYTLNHVRGQCQVKLNQLRVERLGNVLFGASIPMYDGSNLDGFFQTVVIPALNGMVETNFAKIESSLQALCKVKDFQNAGRFEELVKSLL